MKKPLHRVVAISLCLMCVFSISAMFSTSVLAKASSQGPLVVIARDTTAAEHCQSTFILNQKTPSERTVQMPCAAGSNITTFTIPLSTALALHWAYVKLPATNAPVSTYAQFEQQVHALIQSTRLKAVQAAPKVVFPSISCGQYGTEYDTWTASNGDLLESQVHYSEPSGSCPRLFIGEVDEGMFAGSNPISWGYFAYEGSWVWTSCYYLNGDIGNYLWADANWYADAGYQPEWENFFTVQNCSSSEQDHYSPALY